MTNANQTIEQKLAKFSMDGIQDYFILQIRDSGKAMLILYALT